MNKSSIIAASIFLSLSPIANADVVSLVDSYEVPNSEQGVIRPTRGMTMNTVMAKFGTAEQESAAVGEPPITKWTYPEFTVYFEQNIVIYSVVPINQ
jgi:hypothetical protein